MCACVLNVIRTGAIELFTGTNATSLMYCPYLLAMFSSTYPNKVGQDLLAWQWITVFSPETVHKTISSFMREILLGVLESDGEEGVGGVGGVGALARRRRRPIPASAKLIGQTTRTLNGLRRQADLRT